MDSRLGKHFDEVRKKNLKQILKLLRKLTSATKAELAELSGLSLPTVGSLLSELIQTGEISGMKHDSSTGGRPAERFKINALNTLLLAVYVEAGNVFARIYDSSGNKIDEKVQQGNHDNCLENMLRVVDDILTEYATVKFISVGLPAAVTDGIPFHSPDYPVLHGINLQKMLYDRTGLNSYIENDVNCMVKGYALNSGEESGVVYIFLGENGPGSGILNNGDVIKGFGGFAGELGFMPIDGDKNLDVIVKNEGKDRQIEAYGKAVAILACVLNTKIVLFGGVGVDKEFCDKVRRISEKYIPKERVPDCLFAWEVEEDYFSGLVNIGFNKYFNEIELEKN